MTNSRLNIKIEWCKGCAICIGFCPKNVLEMKNKKASIKNIDDCIKCGQCELICPDYAIYLEVMDSD